jgi:hypothetical protein
MIHKSEDELLKVMNYGLVTIPKSNKHLQDYFEETVSSCHSHFPALILSLDNDS